MYEKWPSPDAFPVDLEKRVETVIDGVTWVGVIDRIEQTADGLRVVDYKTSTRAMAQDDAAESIQLGFYALALGREGADVTGAQMWFPRTRAQSITTRSLSMDSLAAVEDELVRITRAIKDEDWAPTVGDHCERCSFRLSCPAWPEGKGAYLP